LPFFLLFFCPKTQHKERDEREIREV